MLLTMSRTHCRKQWGQTAQRFANTSKIEMPLESGQPDQGKCRHLRAAATFVKLPLRRMMDVVTGSRNVPESTVVHMPRQAAATSDECINGRYRLGNIFGDFKFAVEQVMLKKKKKNPSQTKTKLKP